MTSLLLRQFIQGRQRLFGIEYSKIFGNKRPTLLNSVIPNLHQNLYDSTKAFIEAVVALDTEFVQSTATVALQKVLIPEMESLRAARTSIKLVSWKQQKEKKLENVAINNKGNEQRPAIFIVSPYVIFGQPMEERFKLQNPWEYTKPLLTFNRFLAINPTEGFSYSKLNKYEIFGFNCFMIMIKGFEITEGNTTNIYPPRQMLVNFETNSENQEFFVSDFNCLVRSKS